MLLLASCFCVLYEGNLSYAFIATLFIILHPCVPSSIMLRSRSVGRCKPALGRVSTNVTATVQFISATPETVHFSVTLVQRIIFNHLRTSTPVSSVVGRNTVRFFDNERAMKKIFSRRSNHPLLIKYSIGSRGDADFWSYIENGNKYVNWPIENLYIFEFIVKVEDRSYFVFEFQLCI